MAKFRRRCSFVKLCWGSVFYGFGVVGAEGAEGTPVEHPKGCPVAPGDTGVICRLIS